MSDEGTRTRPLLIHQEARIENIPRSHTQTILFPFLFLFFFYFFLLSNSSNYCLALASAGSGVFLTDLTSKIMVIIIIITIMKRKRKKRRREEKTSRSQSWYWKRQLLRSTLCVCVCTLDLSFSYCLHLPLGSWTPLFYLFYGILLSARFFVTTEPCCAGGPFFLLRPLFKQRTDGRVFLEALTHLSYTTNRGSVMRVKKPRAAMKLRYRQAGR